MQNDQDSLQDILARKPDYALLGARADAPVPNPIPGAEASDALATAEQPLDPPYTEQTFTLDDYQAEYQTWLDQSRLYALIDGLSLPDLPGQVSRRHPDVPVTLYHGPFGEHHEAETPRFVRLDADLLEWLQLAIEEDPGWGWHLVLRDDLAGLSPDATLELLTDHFRPLVWVPQEAGGHWLFRLHDPSVLRNWLQCATPYQIERFMAPLRHLVIYTPDAIQVLTPRTIEPPLHITPLPPVPWPLQTLEAMHRLGREELLLRLQAHLHAQHPKTRDWPDEQLRGFMIQNGNRAVEHGFQDEQSMSKFLSLCLVLGADFDGREDGAWARDILNKPTLQGQQSPIDQLVEGALQYLDSTNENDT